MKPLRRPMTPLLPDRLPARTPGENLHETITRLTGERDGVMVRLDEVSRDRNELLDETERLAKERDELLTERDDLSARSLPCYGTATSWPLLPDQGTPIGDELAQQYGGWWA